MGYVVCVFVVLLLLLIVLSLWLFVFGYLRIAFGCFALLIVCLNALPGFGAAWLCVVVLLLCFVGFGDFLLILAVDVVASDYFFSLVFDRVFGLGIMLLIVLFNILVSCL